MRVRPLVCVSVCGWECLSMSECVWETAKIFFFSSFLSIVIKSSVWCLTFLCGVRYCCSSLLRLLSKFQSQNKSHRTSTTSRTNRVCIVTPICTYVLWEGREWQWMSMKLVFVRFGESILQHFIISSKGNCRWNSRLNAFGGEFYFFEKIKQQLFNLSK